MTTEGSDNSSRQALMKAAIPLFALKGFDGVSVREIADKAKVNVSLVNYYFSGKEGLYKSCLQEFGQSNLESTRRVLKAAKSLEELRLRLSMFCEEFTETHFRNPDLAKMVQTEIEAGAPRIADMFKNTFFIIFETLVDFLKQAQKSGFVRTDLDALSQARIFFGAFIHSLKMDCHAERAGVKSLKTPKAREQFIKSLVEIFCTGIVNSELKEK